MFNARFILRCVTGNKHRHLPRTRSQNLHYFLEACFFLHEHTPKRELYITVKKHSRRRRYRIVDDEAEEQKLIVAFQKKETRHLAKVFFTKFVSQLWQTKTILETFFSSFVKCRSC
jgi:hypothetical protein